MDPPQVKYMDKNSLMVINKNGKIRQLFVPFKVEVVQDTELLIKGSTVIVEEVQDHPDCKIVFRITSYWWPYYVFKINIEF